jgi:hypothetical protein
MLVVEVYIWSMGRVLNGIFNYKCFYDEEMYIWLLFCLLFCFVCVGG